ncbi:hypothetical protein RHMOL_RhmolMtG0012100 (mitochondrion) [Rhododendron molle]|nr:hypothetical protein RHMOL_RhmolMtG0012100 [Rhododendron molle]
MTCDYSYNWGIRGILLNRRNIPIMSMPIESMLLAVNSNFLVFSVSSDDMMGQSFASLVPTVAAAESAIGSAIFVITFRVRGTIAVESINSIQGFIIFSRKSLGNTFKVTLDGRIQAIQEESQQFLNPNEVVPPESNEQQRLLRISLRICGTVVESLPMARCAPKCEKTVQALLCRNLNVKSATLPNAISSRRIRLQDDLVTAMAIHLSLRVAPLDLQQGGNSRIPYVHVPAARMSILVYIATAINTFLFLLTKHPLFLRSSGTGTEMGAFSTLFTLVTGGFRGRPMWGTFWVWDARLTSVFISFLIYLGALRFQKLPVEPAPISIRAGPIDIPIIKSSVNWWNTSHQPGSISRSGTSIHVPMPIPILSNFANSPFSTRIFFVLETRLPIPSFLESPLTEQIEAQEGIPKPSSLAESLSIHGGMVKAPNLYKRKIRRFDSCWMHANGTL